MPALRRPSWLRVRRRYLASVLIGAGLTVLVSWWCHLAPNPNRGIFMINTRYDEPYAPRTLERRVAGELDFELMKRVRSLGLTETFVSVREASPDRHSPSSIPTAARSDRAFQIATEYAQSLATSSGLTSMKGQHFAYLSVLESGFPCRSMYCWTEGSQLAPVTFNVQRESYELPRWFTIKFNGLRFELPLGILPLGFVINTLFYAVLIFIPWELLTWARRARRRRRGQCANCAHSLEGLPANTPCPECGTAPRLAAPTNKPSAQAEGASV